jgi:hypothetical protein
MGIFFGLLSTFMLPVMYRRRCGAAEAFHAATAAIMTRPGAALLYLLFSIVLWLAVAMLGCVATCVTCCIAAIPYLGTVILLPLYVFMMSYMLLFVRQYGNDYDAWGAIVASAPAAPTVVGPTPPEPPPLQT